ncbi:MAG TPA: glycosyltransferase family 9 protein [Bacteroidia bacterium]|nr:glycosyltransferase family 9 protein [Bacteroidia bacterium]
MKLRAKQIIDGILGGLLVVFNLMLARPLGLLLRKDHTLRKAPDYIISIKMLGLGSLLLASDALLSLKKRYPNAKMILITGKGVAPGIVPTRLFDQVWTIEDRNIFVLATSSLKILFNSWKLKNRWVVDFEVYSKLTTIFSLWTMALNRFGFQLQKVHFRNFLNTHNSYFNQFSLVQDNYKSLVRLMGVDKFYEFTIPVEGGTGRINEAEKKYIAINNTCSDLSYMRKIPLDILQAVCRMITEQTNYHIAFMGAPGDRTENEEFISKYLEPIKSRVINTAGKLSFTEYYRFLHNDCAMMLTVDSAPLYVALKTGMPTVSVWGPTDPAHRFTPDTFDSQRRKVHYLAVQCSPCLHHTKVLPCGGDNFCMKNMQAADIYSKINGIISSLKNEQPASVAQ